MSKCLNVAVYTIITHHLYECCSHCFSVDLIETDAPGEAVSSTPIQSRETSRQSSGLGSPPPPVQPNLELASPPTKPIPELTLVEWCEGCEYTCQYDECSAQFRTSTGLEDHITRTHCSLVEYKSIYNNIDPSKTAPYMCRVCRVVIKWNKLCITNHLR